MNVCTMDYADFRVEGSQNVCNCLQGFSWSEESLECLRDCEMEFATGQILEGYIDVCVCEEQYQWNAADFLCELNCSTIAYSSGSLVN